MFHDKVILFTWAAPQVTRIEDALNLYKSGKKVDDINPENMCDNVNI